MHLTEEFPGDRVLSAERKLGSDLSVLPGCDTLILIQCLAYHAGWSWHLTRLRRSRNIRNLRVRGAGCQGFNGPYPSAFLDK